MNDRQRLVDQLVLHEDLKLLPYMDSVGKITIGVGRNLSDRGVTRAEALAMLDTDVDEAITDLSGSFPWFLRLDPVRQRVVCDMRFNLGPARFRGFKRLIRALDQQDFDAAATSMRDSLWSRQVKTRADRLIAMMRTGQDYVT